MASARQDYREATALVFFEVCMDSVQAESTYGDKEAALIHRMFTELARAWVPINARRVVDPQMLVSRHKSLAKALRMVWPERRVDGRTILAALMDLGERVWETGRMETRKPWDEMIRLLSSLYDTAEDEGADVLAIVDRGHTIADIVEAVAFEGQAPEWAVKVALEAEAKRTGRAAIEREVREFGGPGAQA